MAAPEKTTRFAADLVDAATIEGARQSRSAKQQLDHWARVGRAVSQKQMSATRRIEAVFAGTLPMESLTDAEAAVLNAEITARLDERLAALDIRGVLHARGVTTVGLDEDGNIIEHRPDGSTSVLKAPAT